MSRENVELKNAAVRQWVFSYEDDTEDNTEAFRDSLHPEIVWCPFEEDNTPLYGIDAAMRSRQQWLDTWGEHQFELEEVIETGDHVLVFVHVMTRGRGSGVEVDVRLYFHFKVRDDKVVYIFEHRDRASALEAVGLRE
jgi:ketosteroid isomerase-like protein